MADSPWYADPTSVDSGTGGSPANNNSGNDNSSSSNPHLQGKIKHISNLPAGKNRVDQVLELVHELDPRDYNRLVETLTFAEQDELTQRLLKIRKKKDKQKTAGKSSWYLSIPEDEERSTGSIILWWEGRRALYNLMVGSAGILSMLAILATSHSNPFTYAPYFLYPILFYAVAANVCYTGGWVTELISKRTWGEKAQYFGPIALGLGTAFSVIITLFPLLIVGMVFFLHLIGMG